jgi:hypothetical protein
MTDQGIAAFAVCFLLVGLVLGAIVGAWCNRRGGYYDGWHEGYGEAWESATANWERAAIERGLARYEQHLERDGMQTRFVWLAPKQSAVADQPDHPRGY